MGCEQDLVSDLIRTPKYPSDSFSEPAELIRRVRGIQILDHSGSESWFSLFLLKKSPYVRYELVYSLVVSAAPSASVFELQY